MHGERRVAALHQYLVDHQPDMLGLMDNANVKLYLNEQGNVSTRPMNMPRLVDGDAPVNPNLESNRYDRERNYGEINSIMRECTKYNWYRLYQLLPRFIRRMPYVKSALDDIKTEHF